MGAILEEDQVPLEGWVKEGEKGRETERGEVN